MRYLVLATLLATTTIAAAQAPQKAPVDVELWSIMETEIHKLSMPEDAHTAIRRLMADVQREASMREQRAKALEAEKKKAEEKKPEEAK